MAEDNTKESIYEEDDLFEEVFGTDDEKIAAKKRLEEKLKQKEKNKEDEENQKNEEDEEIEENEEVEEEKLNKIRNAFTNENNEINKKEKKNKEEIEEDDFDDEEIDDTPETDVDQDPLLFVDIDAVDQEAKINEEKNKKKETTGKLNLKIINDEKPIEKNEEETFEKASDIEKNIIKNVIKNKATKSIKDQVNNKPNWNFEKEAEEIATSNEEKKLEQTKIKPKLSFLEHEDTKHAYIGRKKSVLAKYGEEAGLFVGRVGEEDLNKKPVYLDGLNPHVVFVCGARGSGKSYVLGVIAEELALKNKNVGIVVVDPIGVFWSMKHPNKDEKELEILADWEIMPQGLDNIKVFIPVGMKSSVPKSTYDSTFSIQPSLLTAEDWCLTFGMDRFSPVGLLLDKVLEKVKKGFVTNDEENPKTIRGKENTYSLDDLIYCLDNDNEINGGSKGYKPESIRALVSRFDAAKSWGIFDESGTPLSLLSRAGQMTILDTSFLDDTVGALVIGIISRRLLSARKLSTRRESAGKFEDNSNEELIEINVPPTWLFIDEAHTLIPGGNQKTPASNAIVEYVKQGRRPGLSLVFATQQPSAIDSKVLSQLDVIMAHKLVFDDDVKAIYKRTPTIIPGNYKKPNFIKTLPVGTALTGDRQETTTRAFVMNIRPRMSQHEGRDAETIKIEHNLDEDQVQKLALSIVKSKLQKDPLIKIVLMEQIIETLNATYSKDIKIEKLLELLDKEKIDYDEENIYAPGVLKEIEEEKKEIDEKQKIKEESEEINKIDKIQKKENIQEEYEEEKTNEKYVSETQEEYDSSVELTALKANIVEKDARIKLANLRLKKRFGLFGEEEFLDRLNLKHATIYKITYNYFSQKDAFQIGEVYVNSLTCEFIHDYRGEIVESNGLIDLKELNESEVRVVKLLEEKHDLKSLSEKMDMEQGNVKRILEKLAIKDMVDVTKSKEEFYYFLKKKFDLPPSPLHSILPSIGRRPIIEIESVSIIPPNYSEKEIADLIKKLWKNITIREISQLFLPVWEGVLKKKTGEERIVMIDGINGKQIKIN